MNSEISLQPSWNNRSGKIDRVQIIIPSAREPVEGEYSNIQISEDWNELVRVDSFWEKRGWYLLSYGQGSVFYQCIPTEKDRIKMFRDAILGEEDLDTIYHVCSTGQLFAIDELMHCSEEKEESFLETLWFAVERAIILGLILSNDKSMCRNMNLSPRN